MEPPGADPSVVLSRLVRLLAAPRPPPPILFLKDIPAEQQARLTAAADFDDEDFESLVREGCPAIVQFVNDAISQHYDGSALPSSTIEDLDNPTAEPTFRSSSDISEHIERHQEPQAQQTPIPAEPDDLALPEDWVHEKRNCLQLLRAASQSKESPMSFVGEHTISSVSKLPWPAANTYCIIAKRNGQADGSAWLKRCTYYLALPDSFEPQEFLASCTSKAHLARHRKEATVPTLFPLSNVRHYQRLASNLPFTAIHEWLEGDANVVLTGHGIGGAVASLLLLQVLSDRLGSKPLAIRCFTLGAPLVASPEACLSLDPEQSLYFQHALLRADLYPRICDGLHHLCATASLNSPVDRDAAWAASQFASAATIGEQFEPAGVAAIQAGLRQLWTSLRPFGVYTIVADAGSSILYDTKKPTEVDALMSYFTTECCHRFAGAQPQSLDRTTSLLRYATMMGIQIEPQASLSRLLSNMTLGSPTLDTFASPPELDLRPTIKKIHVTLTRTGHHQARIEGKGVWMIAAATLFIGKKILLENATADALQSAPCLVVLQKQLERSALGQRHNWKSGETNGEVVFTLRSLPQASIKLSSYPLRIEIIDIPPLLVQLGQHSVRSLLHTAYSFVIIDPQSNLAERLRCILRKLVSLLPTDYLVEAALFHPTSASALRLLRTLSPEHLSEAICMRKHLQTINESNPAKGEKETAQVPEMKFDYEAERRLASFGFADWEKRLSQHQQSAIAAANKPHWSWHGGTILTSNLANVYNDVELEDICFGGVPVAGLSLMEILVRFLDRPQPFCVYMGNVPKETIGTLARVVGRLRRAKEKPSKFFTDVATSYDDLTAMLRVTLDASFIPGDKRAETFYYELAIQRTLQNMSISVDALIESWPKVSQTNKILGRLVNPVYLCCSLLLLQLRQALAVPNIILTGVTTAGKSTSLTTVFKANCKQSNATEEARTHQPQVYMACHEQLRIIDCPGVNDGNAAVKQMAGLAFKMAGLLLLFLKWHDIRSTAGMNLIKAVKNSSPKPVIVLVSYMDSWYEQLEVDPEWKNPAASSAKVDESISDQVKSEWESVFVTPLRETLSPDDLVLPCLLDSSSVRKLQRLRNAFCSTRSGLCEPAHIRWLIWATFEKQGWLSGTTLASMEQWCIQLDKDAHQTTAKDILARLSEPATNWQRSRSSSGGARIESELCEDATDLNKLMQGRAVGKSFIAVFAGRIHRNASPIIQALCGSALPASTGNICQVYRAINPWLSVVKFTGDNRFAVHLADVLVYPFFPTSEAVSVGRIDGKRVVVVICEAEKWVKMIKEKRERRKISNTLSTESATHFLLGTIASSVPFSGYVGAKLRKWIRSQGDLVALTSDSYSDECKMAQTILREANISCGPVALRTAVAKLITPQPTEVAAFRLWEKGDTG